MFRNYDDVRKQRIVIAPVAKELDATVMPQSAYFSANDQILGWRQQVEKAGTDRG